MLSYSKNLQDIPNNVPYRGEGEERTIVRGRLSCHPKTADSRSCHPQKETAEVLGFSCLTWTHRVLLQDQLHNSNELAAQRSGGLTSPMCSKVSV
jgi:hypothetical protein